MLFAEIPDGTTDMMGFGAQILAALDQPHMEIPGDIANIGFVPINLPTAHRKRVAGLVQDLGVDVFTVKGAQQRLRSRAQ
jgi:hypothetical protein